MKGTLPVEGNQHADEMVSQTTGRGKAVCICLCWRWFNSGHTAGCQVLWRFMLI